MNVTALPTAKMLWQFRQGGRTLGGVVRVPQCEGALEALTRVLMMRLIGEHGFTRRDFAGPHHFILRRVAQ